MSSLRKFWGLLLLLLLAPIAAPAAPHVQVELVSESNALVPGQTDTLAVHFKPDPKWHIYWHYPGEAGLPVTLKWDTPKGVTAGETLWPYPTRLVVSDLVNYVYEGETALLVPVQAASDLPVGTNVTIKLSANWLTCSDSCVPGDANLTITLPVANKAEPTAAGPMIEQVRQRVPVSNGLSSVSASAVNGKIELKFTPLEGTVSKAELFPDDENQIDIKAPQTLQGKDTLVLTPANGTTQTLKGTLVLEQDGKEAAYLVNVTLGAAPPPATTSVPEAILLAFLGGLVLNLMPCVFPVLSLKVLGLVDQARKTEEKPWKHGLVFALGVMLSFWVLAGGLFALRAGGQHLGWGFQFQSPRFVASMAFLFFLIALNLLGVFEVGEDLTRVAELGRGKTGYADALWSGALVTLAATPCTAPFMGAAVGVALTLPVWQGMAIFSSLAFGVALPYVVFTSFPRLLRLLPRPGAWMETFKQLMAFPMLATCAYFLWVLGQQTGTDGESEALAGLVGLGLAGWMLGRWGWDPRSQTIRLNARAASTLIGLASVAAVLTMLTPGGKLAVADGWQPYSPELVEKLRGEDKPVFVDFTAAWCLSCKVNERVAIGSASVQKRFKELNVQLVRGDWTNSDPVITKALASFGRSGVPLYVYYPKGKGQPVVLPEVLTPEIVLTKVL